MNTLKLSLLAAAGSCIAATSAHAHHPGGPGNSGSTGPINTISASTLPAGISVVSVVYDQIGLDPLSDATLASAAEAAHDAGLDHAHVHSMRAIISPSLNYAYGITSDLMVAVRLPYVLRRDIREGHFHEDDGEAEVHHAGNADGFGDVSALAQWRFFNAAGLEAALLGGVKAPTGSTRENDSEGDRFDAEFQPGSGSWDGMIGLALTRRFSQWSFDASVLYTAVGTGTQHVDLGDRLHYNAAVSYRLSNLAGGGAMFHGAKPHAHGADARGHVHTETTGPAIDFVLELNGEWHDKQKDAGEEDPNSGGNVIYLAPGIRLSQDKWSAFASIGLPIVNDMNGIQAEPDWRLVTGMSVAF